MAADVLITADGTKFFKDDIEVTNGVKINRHHVAVGCDIKDPVTIIIPPDVKAIEEHAFQDLESLEAVYIPESVKMIGLNAFWGCANLSRVILSDSVETVKFRHPQGKWDIESGKPFKNLAEMLRKGGYVVYLYKSGEDFSWD